MVGRSQPLVIWTMAPQLSSARECLHGLGTASGHSRDLLDGLPKVARPRRSVSARWPPSGRADIEATAVARGSTRGWGMFNLARDMHATQDMHAMQDMHPMHFHLVNARMQSRRPFNEERWDGIRESRAAVRLLTRANSDGSRPYL